MDGFMPIKTGWDATRAIREREAAAAGGADVVPYGGLIIIGVTGATTSEDAKKCIDCGMTDFIPKVMWFVFDASMALLNCDNAHCNKC